ncbi:hypothetical protein [Kutzneria buriramensis]|uniref:Uncharacterized protein n=1 Tax=Kutzneria buriramensis TaxID=1045776 RepID=A0A3E0HG24_9PSEU|nr:hypothetical protein [Kutzneria buriramensis]REH44659.1 hypothetical protein BCF44_108139 [Kutzneria buriramensis]
MSDNKSQQSTVEVLADAGLEALATTWPVAETGEEMDDIVDGTGPGGDQ